MRKGFTLIEVLVVAVIVAILAAVAIPAYQSYIDSTYDDISVNTLSTAASMASADKARGIAVSTAISTAVSNMIAGTNDNVVGAAASDSYVVTGTATHISVVYTDAKGTNKVSVSISI